MRITTGKKDQPKTDEKPLVFLYARVSSKEQEEGGFSIPAQVKYLREYATREGIEVTEVVEEAFSAKESGRPGFSNIMKRAKAHLTTGQTGRRVLLLVEKTDRLTRNFYDFMDLENLVKVGLTIHLPKDNAVWDIRSGSKETFVLGLHALMARNYVQNLSEEVKKGQKEKASRGLWPSYAPIGYRNNLADRTIEPDPVEAPLVRNLFAMAETGKHTLEALSRLSFAEGLRSRRAGKQINKYGVVRILNNPIYAGTYIWSGQRVEGTHAPLISPIQFERVQQALGMRLKPRVNCRHFPFSGFMTCAYCGCAVSGQLQKGRLVYYSCSRGRGRCPGAEYVREESLTEQFGEALKALRMDDDLVEWVRKELLALHADKTKDHEENIVRLQTRQTKLRGFMSQAYTDKLEGLLSTADFMAKKQAWEEELADIESRLIALRRADTRTMLEGVRIIDAVRHAHEVYSKANPLDRRQILGFVLSNPTLDGKKACYKWKSPFHLMAEGASITKWRSLRDLNARPPA